MIPAKIIHEIIRNVIDKSKMKYDDTSKPKNSTSVDNINAVTD